MPTMYDFIRLYTVEELQKMTPIDDYPDVSSAWYIHKQQLSDDHVANLLLERKDDCRLWYSRMTIEDGAEGNHEVIVEVYNHEIGKWFEWQTYNAADIEQGLIYYILEKH